MAEGFGQERDIFNPSAAQGYNRVTAERSPSDLSEFPTSAGDLQAHASPSLLSSIFSSANGGGLTAQLTGIDYVGTAPRVQQDVKFSSETAATINVTAQATLTGNIADIGEAKAGLSSSIEDLQDNFRAALEQSGQNAGIDQGAIDTTFGPDSTISSGEVVGTTVMAATGIPVAQKISTASTLSDAVGIARSVAGGLTNEQESKIADQLRSIISQAESSPQTLGQEDAQQSLHFSPETKAHIETLTDAQLIETVKMVMIPAAYHPDMITLELLEREAEHELGLHQRFQYETDMALGLGNKFGITEDVSIAEIEFLTDLEMTGMALNDPSYDGVQAIRVPTEPLFIAHLDAKVRELQEPVLNMNSANNDIYRLAM